MPRRRTWSKHRSNAGTCCSPHPRRTRRRSWPGIGHPSDEGCRHPASMVPPCSPRRRGRTRCNRERPGPCSHRSCRHTARKRRGRPQTSAAGSQQCKRPRGGPTRCRTQCTGMARRPSKWNTTCHTVRTDAQQNRSPRGRRSSHTCRRHPPGCRGGTRCIGWRAAHRSSRSCGGSWRTSCPRPRTPLARIRPRTCR